MWSCKVGVVMKCVLVQVDCVSPDHLVESVLCQRMSISEPNVVLMRSCLWAEPVQNFHQAFSLYVCPFLDGGAPSNFLVVFPDDWRSSLSNQGTELAAGAKGSLL